MGETSSPPADSLFPETRWTLITEVQAGGIDGTRALEELCDLYWYPVYAFARRSGTPPSDAEDLTQGFFAYLITRENFARADAAKGRLRGFLLSSLKHFRINKIRHDGAQKRGGGCVSISFDHLRAEERYQHEPADLDDPEAIFERRWALDLLDKAFERLEAEYVKNRKHELYLALRPSLASPGQNERQAVIGERLGMSPGAVQVAVHRLKKRYRMVLENVVAETLDDPSELEEELRHILRVLATT